MSTEETNEPAPERNHVGQLRAVFDRRDRQVPEPFEGIVRIVRLTDRLGPHGGPLYGDYDGLAIETKADPLSSPCCWWGSGPISQETHKLVSLTPAASWE
jgi:hypothetical protein